MPLKCTSCGVYEIVTLKGSRYIGSSKKIEQRWCEHKSKLRKGKHHSLRLQNAYNKYKGFLIYNIIELCGLDELSICEQKQIDRLKPNLNMSSFVENNWADPEVRKKRMAIYSSKRWSDMSRKRAQNCPTRWKKVDCSNGKQYKNLTEAGRAFGIRASFVKQLIKNKQISPKYGVKFKYSTDKWVKDIDPKHRTWEARRKNKTDRHSEASIKKMSAAKAGWKPTLQMTEAARKACTKRVQGLNIETGSCVVYQSIKEASMSHYGKSPEAAASQIARCAKKNKVSYGYLWSYAKDN